MPRGTTSRLALLAAVVLTPSSRAMTVQLPPSRRSCRARSRVENQLRSTDGPARPRALHSGPFETGADAFLYPHPLLFRQAGEKTDYNITEWPGGIVYPLLCETAPPNAVALQFL